MLLGLSPNRLASRTRCSRRSSRRPRGARASIVAARSAVAAAPGRARLTAALFARFTSFWIACLVGLAIGMLQSILYYFQTQSWFPTDNGVAMPACTSCSSSADGVAMFVRGTSLPTRGELVEQRLPLAPRAQRLWQPRCLGRRLRRALIVFPTTSGRR
jgi:branched-chain amino acid transport system permease protein